MPKFFLLLGLHLCGCPSGLETSGADNSQDSNYSSAVCSLPELCCQEVGRGGPQPQHALGTDPGTSCLSLAAWCWKGSLRPWVHLFTWVPFNMAPVISQAWSVDQVRKWILLTACEVGVIHSIWQISTPRPGESEEMCISPVAHQWQICTCAD